jgi:hypothetical protein
VRDSFILGMVEMESLCLNVTRIRPLVLLIAAVGNTEVRTVEVSALNKDHGIFNPLKTKRICFI